MLEEKKKKKKKDSFHGKNRQNKNKEKKFHDHMSIPSIIYIKQTGSERITSFITNDKGHIKDLIMINNVKKNESQTNDVFNSILIIRQYKIK